MKLINSSFEIWEQDTSINLDGILYSKEVVQDSLKESMYKHIEKCGRTCYKSEEKINEASAEPFVNRLINSKHYAMLEHASVYLKHTWGETTKKIFIKYDMDRFSKYECDSIGEYVSTNLRVLYDNNWLDDLKYLCSPEKQHHLRITVKFICPRNIANEFVRHRVFSFAQESTRYCNYTKNKFGSELTFIKPFWVDTYTYNNAKVILENTFQTIENNYFKLIESGWKSQEAAAILPNALKTELCMTGFVEDWKHFFDLRAKGTTGAPHPQAKEIALPLYNEFIKRKYIND